VEIKVKCIMEKHDEDGARMPPYWDDDTVKFSNDRRFGAEDFILIEIGPEKALVSGAALIEILKLLTTKKKEVS
jgi:hypothetical protein